MVSRGPKLIGYVDQPLGTLDGDSDVARLREAGVMEIRHEVDLVRRSVWREMTSIDHKGDVLVVVALDRLGHPMRSLLRSVASLCGNGVGLRSLGGGVDLGTTLQGLAQACVVDALVERLDVWEIRRARHRGKIMTERGRRPGAQPKLGAATPEEVMAMLERPGAIRAAVARKLGVGRTTLYRYLSRTLAHS